MSAWAGRLQRLRVPFGFAFFLAYFYFSTPGWISLICGAAIALVGLLLRAWASGHLRKNQQLATSGPYASTRNPLYLGSLLLVIGFGACSANWWLAVASIALFFGIYLPVMNREEQELAEIFGERFQIYRRTIPRLFPKFRFHQGGAGRTKFEAALYFHYREYRAALGFAGVVAALAVKILWLKS